MVIAYIGLIALSVVGLLFISRPTIQVRHKRELGVFGSQLIYSDEDGGKLLFSERYNLQGKPDYIFQTFLFGNYIPLEVKSGHCKEDIPHEGDLMQLVAYFLIVEEVYHKRPRWGKLVYTNKTFKVRNTRKLRKHLYALVDSMRSMLDGDLDRTVTPSYIKCKNCVCKDTVCTWYE